MFLDLRDAGTPSILKADLCIIGGGAAGITLAREFIGTSYQVVVLEAGGRNIDPINQQLYNSTSVGHRHAGVHSGRGRAFGGTTNLWAGQALPLHADDFQHRPWIAYSGWPIAYAAMAQYYERAEEAMEVDHVRYNADDWPSQNVPQYERADFALSYSQFAAQPNFAKKYGALLRQSATIHVVLHANVTNIEVNADANHALNVKAQTLDGRPLVVDARFIVVCAGGIETARCLLASTSVEANGIGNRFDVVGRYLQDHVAFNLPIRPIDKLRFARWCHSFYRRSTRYSLRVLPSSSFVENNQILQICAEIHYPVLPGLVAAKDILRTVHDPSLLNELPRSLGVALRNPLDIAKAAYTHYVLGRPASLGQGAPHIGFYSEQAPNPDSRVLVDWQNRDQLGLPKLVVDWRLTDLESSTIRVFGAALREEFRVREVGTFGNDFPSGNDDDRLIDMYHHIGTCRMGTDPHISVVDEACRVHGYDNLFIASSAVFPTGGYSNPTLTILALTLRIADSVKQRLCL